MRVIIQRVTHATVEVDESVVGEVGKGILVLVGFENNESSDDIEWLSQKITNLRIFDDEHGKMNLSVKDVGGKLLIVSQFTLHAQTKKGNRPSYNKAADPEEAEKWYQQLVDGCQMKMDEKIETGIFGSKMKVNLENDGPVTIFIDTKHKE